MNDGITSISASLGQIVASMAGTSGLLIWRSAALGATFHAIGRIRRVRRIETLSTRARRLRGFYRCRLILFSLFTGCLASCLWSLFSSIRDGGWIFQAESVNPGLLKILTDRISLQAANASLMSLVAFLLLFAEWVVDGICQAYDLEASLAILRSEGRLELAETIHFRLEAYVDLLTLWQLRVRYCVAEQGDRSLTSILEGLGDSDVDWPKFSTAVCGFRINSRKTASSSPLLEK